MTCQHSSSCCSALPPAMAAWVGCPGRGHAGLQLEPFTWSIALLEAEKTAAECQGAATAESGLQQACQSHQAAVSATNPVLQHVTCPGRTLQDPPPAKAWAPFQSVQPLQPPVKVRPPPQPPPPTCSQAPPQLQAASPLQLLQLLHLRPPSSSLGPRAPVGGRGGPGKEGNLGCCHPLPHDCNTHTPTTPPTCHPRLTPFLITPRALRTAAAPGRRAQRGDPTTAIDPRADCERRRDAAAATLRRRDTQ